MMFCRKNINFTQLTTLQSPFQSLHSRSWLIPWQHLWFVAPLLHGWWLCLALEYWAEICVLVSFCHLRSTRHHISTWEYLSNSSMQQRPPSASTRAPASSIHSPALQHQWVELSTNWDPQVVQGKRSELYLHPSLQSLLVQHWCCQCL